jgi:hypothetical protein
MVQTTQNMDLFLCQYQNPLNGFHLLEMKLNKTEENHVKQNSSANEHLDVRAVVCVT